MANQHTGRAAQLPSGFELGAVVIRVPDRDLGETLHSAAAVLQPGGGTAGHQAAEDGAAAAQVLDGPVPGHRHRREGQEPE